MKKVSSRVVARWWVPPLLLFRLVLLLVGVTSLAPLAACPYSIRDSAFIGGTAASPYELQILVSGDQTASGSVSKDKITEWLSVGASAWLEAANVEARVLDVSDGGARDALPEGFSIPRDFPAAILVSPGGAATTLPGIAPGKISLDAVMATALGIVESPLRKDIHKRLAKAWCVVLLLEGTDAAENTRARKAFEVAARSITGQATEMGKVVTAGPELLSVSHQSPEESILLWSLGLESSGEEKVPVRAVMLIGRGERRGPLLEGDELTSGELLEMFTMLGRSCSCTTDEMWLSGPALPLEWSEEIQALVKIELGFDPRNPEALGAIKGVLEGASASSPFSEAALGYTETFLGMDVESDPGLHPVTESFVDISTSTARLSFTQGDAQAEASDSEKAVEAASGPASSSVASSSAASDSSSEASNVSLRAGHGALLALSGLALLVLVVVTFIVLRARSE